MERCVGGVRHYSRHLTDRRVIVSLIGIFLAFLFHELFHIAMHWGDITQVGVFTSLNTVAEIAAHASPHYDVEGEEMAAYAITLMTLLATAVIVAHLTDKKDTRTFSDTVKASSNDLQELSARDLMELAHRSGLLGMRQ